MHIDERLIRNKLRHMKHVILVPAILLGTLSMYAQTSEQTAAQEKIRMDKLNAGVAVEEKDGWTRKGGIGLDLGQLLNINPYVGAGSDRLGIGGALSFKTLYKKGMFSWKSDFLVNFTAQRIGSGVVSSGSSQKVPFEKALDQLHVNTNFAYKAAANSHWSYSLDLGLRTQLLNSYIDSSSKKIYLTEIKEGNYNTSLVSKIFSPALITLAPGMQYTKAPKWNFFLSPVAGQVLLISDQKIANLGVHGTELKKGSSSEYETSKVMFGALAKVAYSNIYFTKLNVTSELSLYSDYLDNPQNIDVIWTNNFALEIYKGLNLSVRADLYYDHNKLNSISDSKAVGGISGVGRRVNFIEQLLVNYTRTF